MNTNDYNLVLERVPPGDRWTMVHGTDNTIYNSLTEGLNAVYMENKSTVFLINASAGRVYIIKDNLDVVNQPIKKFSLYDE